MTETPTTNRKFAITKTLTDYSFPLMIALALGTMLYSTLSDIQKHKIEVEAISKQNVDCIYLESSDLGKGQHYMICNNQIVLKRLSDVPANDAAAKQLEAALPPEPKGSNTPTEK